MDRSLDVYKAYREAQDKFDMYVLGAVLAICAYLGQSMPYARLGINAESMFLLSLLTFVTSAYFGFRRIELMIVGYRLNHSYLDALEKRNQQEAAWCRQALDEVGPKTSSSYNWRNRLMFVGLVFFVTGKYWAVYVNT
jgi:hypothetical protein